MWLLRNEDGKNYQSTDDFSSQARLVRHARNGRLYRHPAVHRQYGSQRDDVYAVARADSDARRADHIQTWKTVPCGSQERNDFAKKATSVQFEMMGDAENGDIYDGTMICIQNELLKEFITTAKIQTPQVKDIVKTAVHPMDSRLISFVQSLAPYYNAPVTINPALLKLKVMELLFNVAECSEDAFRQMLQLLKPVKADIRHVVEHNYTNPLILPELAYLSGRSLSGFKREFQAIYNMPPAQWLLGKRLERAADMLKNTPMSVTDICFTLGFESPAHFSRAFKKQYGYSPAHYKLNNQ